MAKIRVVLNVDTDQLRQTREEAIGKKQAKQESLSEAISQELGWVNASGISVESVEDEQETIEAELGRFVADDGEHYPLIVKALRKALKNKPDVMIDSIEYKKGETISPIDKLEFTYTVKQFCDLIGIE